MKYIRFLSGPLGSFLSFTAVFTVLVTCVFWGTWSLDVTPVMPDDPIRWYCSWGELFRGELGKFLSTGLFCPADVLWDGLLGSRWFCQEFKYAVALYCSGLGLAYFLRGRGLSRLASYGAGLLLAFCGYWCTLFSAGHGGWFVWMTFGVFAFGLVDRAVSAGRIRHWVLLAATVAWASFYQADLWFLFTFFTGMYFVFRCLAERKFPWKGVLVAAVVFFAISAPSLKSAFAGKAGREKDIARGDTLTEKDKDGEDARWIFCTNWSLPPAEVAEFFVPRVNGDTSCPLTLALGRRAGADVKPYTGALGRPKDAPAGNYRQHSLYVGFVTCLLALAAVVLRLLFRRSAAVPADGALWFFALSAVLFCLLSFGRYFEPLYRLVFALPVGDTLRAPVKWHHLTEFCLVVLAGYGIDFLGRILAGLGRKPLAWILPALVFAGAVDLAYHASLYCSPVDYSAAKARNCEMDMTFLQQQQFQDPQIAAAVKGGAIRSLAYYPGRSDVYLVGVLRPHKPDQNPLPGFGLAAGLGVVSVLASLLAIGFCVRDLRRLP